MKKVREGYKMTELGEIPEEWELTRLQSIAQICYGKSQKEVEIDSGKYNILGTGGVIGKTDNFLWNEPSVLIGRKGTIDKPQYIEEPFWTVDTLFYTKINEEFIAKWLYYYLNNIDLKKYNEATGVPSLSASVLNNINIVTPSKSEQQKISLILTSVDEQIEITNNLIEKTKELKKGLMQKLLTKGIGHSRFKDTEIVRIPEKWEIKKLLEVSEFGNGKSHEQNISESGDYIVINSKFISTDGKIKKYTDDIMCPLEKGDIVMVMSDLPNGKALGKCYLIEKSNLYSLNQRICSLKAIGLDNIYLFYYLNRNKYFLKYDDGVKQTNLRKAEVLDCPILVPSLDEQRQIASILSSVDKQIYQYESKKEKLQELKKGLMQKLLAGRIRVKV